MKAFVSAGAALLFLLAIGCDGGGDGTGGKGGEGGTGGTTSMGGSGGTGGGMGGAGGGMGGAGGMGGGTTTGTGGAGGGGGGAAFGEMCAMETDCADGLVCFDFNQKGQHCTLECSSAADCPAPSSGCNGMGYCKLD